MKQNHPSFTFGDTPEMADALLALVLEGKKTATCSALESCRRDNSPLPKAGEHYHVLDSTGRIGCTIEITRVDIRRFSEIDEDFAYQEGEGDRSLSYWKNEHRRFFESAGDFHEDMELVCEYFKVI